MKDKKNLNYRNLPNPLIRAIDEVYTPAGCQLTVLPCREKESEEYRACRFEINGKKVIYRVAKTTPKKVGQFVTCWKRETLGAPITPFEYDDIDYLIVGISDKERLGQLIFNREILIKKGIVSHHGNDGKLSFRVYGPWVIPTISSAIKAQKWQLEYYVDINQKSAIIERFKVLLN